MPHARKTDPTTSFEAAGSVFNINKVQQNIISCLIVPMTDDELLDTYYRLSDSYGWVMASPSGIRSRRSELVAMGLVEDSGMRKKSWSGRNAIVWRLTDDVQ